MYAASAPVSALEAEADRVADLVVGSGHAGACATVAGRAPPGFPQRQEKKRPESPPPSTTAFPGQSSQSPEEEKQKKVDEGFKKLGEGLAKKVLSDAEQIPGVKEVYTALEALFENPVVMALAGIGYTTTTATIIVKNAVDRAAEGTPGSFPIEETKFGVKGGFDVASGLSDLKFMTPIGDLPPSLTQEEPAAPPKPLFAPPSLVPSRDLIGERLREARRQEIINTWVMSQQGLVLQPAEEVRRKEEDEARRPPPISVVEPLFKRAQGEDGATSVNEPATARAGFGATGRPLESALRDRLQRAFSFDFASVRIHDGDAAATAAAALGARAYTVGNDIAFASGEYRPASSEGLRLLAHELTHVVQQRGAPAPAAREAQV